MEIKWYKTKITMKYKNENSNKIGTLMKIKYNKNIDEIENKYKWMEITLNRK